MTRTPSSFRLGSRTRRIVQSAPLTVARTATLAVALAVAQLAPSVLRAEAPEDELQARIEVGEFHLRSGRWREAADVFGPLAERTDAPAAVFRGLGEAFHNLGRTEDAVRAFEDAQRRGDERSRLLLVDMLGDRRDGWPRAIELLKEHTRNRPDDLARQRQLAELLVYEGRIAEAVPVLRGIVAAHPDDAAAALLLARTLSWTGKFADAAPLFARAVSGGAALQADDLKLRGQAHEALGETREAHAAYREFVASTPNDPVALAGLARAALDLGRKDEARRAVDTLRSVAGRDPESELMIARLDVRMGRVDEALPGLQRALDENPSPTLALEVADALVAAGRVDEAVALIDRHPDPSPRGLTGRLRILAAAPEQKDAARALAVEALGATDDAETARIARDLMLGTADGELGLDLAEAVGRRFPSDRAVQAKRANLLLARGQRQGAESVLRQLHGASPRDADVTARLVATQIENRNFDGARATLRAAGNLVGRDARLLSMRAGLHFRDGKLEQARADYDAALALAPRLGEARIGRAEVALALGDVQGARRRIEAEPALPARTVANLRERLAYRERLDAFRAQPSESLARDLEPRLRAELQREPDRADLRLVFAQVLEASGRSREALAQYALLQSAERADREAFLAPLRIHLALGEHEEAERAFARFRERFPGEEDLAQARLLAGQGERHKRSGAYAEALDAYRSALTLAPSSTEVWKGKAGVHFAAGELDSAIEAFERALALDPQDADARRGRRDAVSGLAGQALERGDSGRAVAHIERLIAVSDGDTVALERAAELAGAAQRWDLAAAAANRLPDPVAGAALRERIELDRELAARLPDSGQMPPAELLQLARRGLAAQPDRVDLILIEAQALERHGRAEEALARFREAARRNAPSSDAYGGQVRMLTALGRHAEAGTVLAELDRRDPSAARTAEVALRLAEADAAKRRGDHHAALAAVRRAKQVDPDSADATLALAGIYAAAGQHADAVAAYRAALAARPGDAVATRGLAGSLFARGDHSAAAALYDEILRNAPGDRDANQARVALRVAEAGRLLEADRAHEAERVLDRALSADPAHRDAVAMKLRLLGARGAWAEARSRIQGLADPAERRSWEEWLEIEEGLARWRREPEAIPPVALLGLVERGLRRDPGRADLLLARAQVLETQGDRARALAAYRSLGPEAAPEALAGQVRLLIAMRRFDEAERLLDRQTVMRPEATNRERATIFRGRAAAMRELDRHEDAFAAARDALALAPDDADALSLLGWIYLDAKQPRDAAASFARVLDQRPSDRAALEGLASAYESAGDWPAAARVFDEILASPGAAPTDAFLKRRDLVQVAQLRAERRFESAAEQLERLRARDPRDPALWAALSEVRHELGQSSLGLTYAEQGLQLAPRDERLHLARIRALSALGRDRDLEAALTEAGPHVGSATLDTVRAEVARAQRRRQREQWSRDGRLDLVYLGLAEEYQETPQDPDTLRAIGYLYLQTDQFAESRHFFERAARLDPDAPEGRLGLAYALRGAGDGSAAANELEHVMRSRPNPEAALALAELYHDQGRNRDAENMLREARRLSAESAPLLPPLHVGRARMAGRAEGAAAAGGSTLPPLHAPQGVIRVVPARPGAGLELEEERPRGWWRDGRVGLGVDAAPLAFADNGIVNDAAPPEAAAFAGPALDALRRTASGAAGGHAAVDLHIAQALPGFDQVMDEVRGTSAPRRAAPPTAPTPVAGDPIRDEYISPYQDPAVRPAPREANPWPPPSHEPVRAFVPAYPAPPPPSRHVPALPPAYRPRLYLEREPAGAGLPIQEPIEAPAPLTAQARARLTALERKLQRAQAMKLSVGFRYDFFRSVSDVNANEFALWRFPVFLEVPALLQSHLRVTAEPTIVDNGLVTDAGVAGEVALLGLRLGTDVAQASLGVGSTPAGFEDQVDITGFGRLTLQASPRISFTPFFERKPLIESLLSYRGNEREGLFFGKIILDRFGGAIGFRTPQEITGVLEAAYGQARGRRVERNERLDGFVSIGRDFPLDGEFVLRPGAQGFFMHYGKDLSEAYPLGLDPLLFPPAEFPRGGGYFSPDAFLEAALRLDLTGPFFTDHLPDATFRLGGRVGGQWVSGLETARFASSEGSRATYGGDAAVSIPMGDMVVFSAGGGFVVARPYDRVYFEMALLFPL